MGMRENLQGKAVIAKLQSPTCDILIVREGTMLRHAEPDDLAYIETLRRKEGSALGFLPIAVYESVLHRQRIANRDRWKHGIVLVTEDNGDLTGFCYATLASRLAKIVQIVVQQDARRWHRALLMADAVEQEAKMRGRFGITCRVAIDLESNLFWRAVGYTPVGEVNSTWLNQKESVSRRPLLIYEKHFGGLFDVAELG